MREEENGQHSGVCTKLPSPWEGQSCIKKHKHVVRQNKFPHALFAPNHFHAYEERRCRVRTHVAKTSRSQSAHPVQLPPASLSLPLCPPSWNRTRKTASMVGNSAFKDVAYSLQSNVNGIPCDRSECSYFACTLSKCWARMDLFTLSPRPLVLGGRRGQESWYISLGQAFAKAVGRVVGEEIYFEGVVDAEGNRGCARCTDGTSPGCKAFNM